MKQFYERTPNSGVAAHFKNWLNAKHSLLATHGRLPIRLSMQPGTTMPEFIVRRADSTNAVCKFLLDRLNDRTLRTATRPVLLCKASRRARYRRILVQVDFTESGRMAAEFAIACFPSAQIVFLHAFYGPENPIRETRLSSGDIHSQRLISQERAIAKLVHLIDELRPSDNLISRVAHYGPSFSVITNYAAKMGADLILIGSQKQPCFKEMLFGSMASRIANCTGTDVLVVPPQRSKQGISLAGLDGNRREHRRMIPVLPSYKA